MKCAECEELLQPYLDLELDPLTSAKIEIHLENCRACKKLFDRAKAPPPPPGPEPRAEDIPDDPAEPPKYAARRPDSGPRFLPRSYRQLGLVMLLTALAAAGITLRLMPSSTTGPNVLDRLMSAHVRSMMADHLIDMPATDPDTLQKWFEARLDFTPPVPDLDGAGFPLIGGRVDYVAGHKAAALIYRHDAKVINLFIWQGRLGDDGAGSAGPNGDQINEAAWAEGGLVFHAVSNLGNGTLDDFENQYRNASS